MIYSNYYQNNNDKNFILIQKFYTRYDSGFNRKNHYVDIKYSEMKITFNKNKVYFNLIFHVAGNFSNFPIGIIKCNLSFPNIEIENVSLHDSNLKVNDNFLYGYPDASKIFYSNFVVDINDFETISNSNFFDCYITYNLDYSLLENFQLDKKILSEFSNDLSNIKTHFIIPNHKNNIFSSKEALKHEFKNIYEIKIISDSITNKNIFVESSFETKYDLFFIYLNNYLNINYAINDLFYIKKTKDVLTSIKLKDIQIQYSTGNDIRKTNIFELNENFIISNNMTIKNENLKIYWNDNSKEFEIISGSSGLFYNNLIGKYILTFELSSSGKTSSIKIENEFSFKDNKLKIDFIQGENYIIDENKPFEEIEIQ